MAHNAVPKVHIINEILQLTNNKEHQWFT